MLSQRPVFLSTLSLRRATGRTIWYKHRSFISIHALLAESDASRHQKQDGVFGISIHALLAESDFCTTCLPPWAPNFYPRSPCGERQIPHRGQNPAPRFLSTLSLRRATDKDQVVKCLAHDFYPRSPCGERLHYDNYNLHCVEISIHALLAESDAVFVLQITFFDIFLSTLSLRRATLLYHFCPVGDKHFYPRSPCGERHSYSQHVIRPSGYFYPRSPCGERH